ncbi:MAG: hypothetical protein KatS3mg016_0750 [Fimbriimonadales bacterium]|nr:MAG: hypothetical protein KatS3mg016_0750 [Fimbriimonadales bacterium]
MRFCSVARVNCLLLVASLLWSWAFATEPGDALLQAQVALEQARRARPTDRKVFLQEAKRALASLPTEARESLEKQIEEVSKSSDLASIERALSSVKAYRETLEPSPSPSPAPQAVKTQLERIFAEPDMQVPPKSLLERASEVFLQAIESLVRWVQRLLGGAGLRRLGGLEPFLQWFVIVLLVLTIGLAVSYLMGRVRLSRRARSTPLPLDEAFRDARSMSALEWRELARRFAFEKNWQLAARACYLGILRLLHETRLLDYDPALTNWEHLQRLRQPPLPRFATSPAPLPDPALREEAYTVLHPLTLQFDALWYGGITPDDRIYRQFEESFETLLRRLEAYAIPA